jgi:cell division protein FtsI (penicillin-binding protein 3)
VHKVGPQGYIDDQYVALFVGIAPVEDPRFVTVVVIDQPKGEAYGGGSAAAPVFSRVAEGTLRLLSIPPSQSNESNEAGVVAALPTRTVTGAAG